jgi:apolipoprotein D and lipocalin family protein
MNLLVLSSFLALFAVGSVAMAGSTRALEVVPEVDLNRYAGTWYEIARLPNWFQKKCAGDVTATYTVLDDGDIKVVNRCRKENGQMTEVEGRAKRASDDEPNTKLKVRFAPKILSFLPFVWGNYWIILLAPDYSYAVVGEPTRKYMWILSRTPAMDETTFQGILGQVKEKGYDLTRLIRTKQGGK